MNAACSSLEIQNGVDIVAWRNGLSSWLSALLRQGFRALDTEDWRGWLRQVEEQRQHPNTLVRIHARGVNITCSTTPSIGGVVVQKGYQSHRAIPQAVWEARIAPLLAHWVCNVHTGLGADDTQMLYTADLPLPELSLTEPIWTPAWVSQRSQPVREFIKAVYPIYEEALIVAVTEGNVLLYVEGKPGLGLAVRRGSYNPTLLSTQPSRS